MNDIQNGIDILEDLANGDGVAYWEDAEEFFRRYTWELALKDPEFAEPVFCQKWELDIELPPPPPRPDLAP